MFSIPSLLLFSQYHELIKLYQRKQLTQHVTIFFSFYFFIFFLNQQHTMN